MICYIKYNKSINLKFKSNTTNIDERINGNRREENESKKFFGYLNLYLRVSHKALVDLNTFVYRVNTNSLANLF